MPEVKTETYKGTLVDASCAGSAGGAGSQATANRSGTGAGTTAGNTQAGNTSAANAQGGGNKGEASRSDMAGGSCAASSNTTQFALKMKDGKTVTFDMVGNERAQQALKNKKKWTEAASAGKPIRAKVSGVMEGDRLTVVSVD
jgi:hypothetical protein